MKSSFANRGLAGLVVAALFLPGCGGKSAKLVPVSGKVTLDGQPVTSGQVTLIQPVKDPTAESPAGSPTGLITGPIDSTGSYKVFTDGKEGAPLGRYKVTVTPSMMPMSAEPGKTPSLPFDMTYGDPSKTPLEYTVVESAAAGTYDLKLTK
jgi:hypothetical protein